LMTRLLADSRTELEKALQACAWPASRRDPS
jgi:hypothetical protein